MEEQEIMLDPSEADTTAPGGEDMDAAEADPQTVASDGETESQGEETTEPDEAESTSSSEETVYMPVFNGEVRPIRADDREEITTLLQLGMKQRDFLPEYEMLRQIAADIGMSSVKELVGTVAQQYEERLLQKAIAAYGEREGREFYELHRQSRTRRVEEQKAAAKKRQDDATDKLVRDFEELQREYPDIRTFQDVPRSVIENALTKGISLLDAQNRFVLTEQKRVGATAEASGKAGKSAVGSLASSGVPEMPEMEAFLSGFYGRQ